jgi:hypothetical protein
MKPQPWPNRAKPALVSPPATAQIARKGRLNFLYLGVRYFADMEGGDSAIGGLGLGSTHDTGSRVSVPMSIGLRVDF